MKRTTHWQSTKRRFSSAVSLGLDEKTVPAEALRRIRLLTLTTAALCLIGVPSIGQFVRLGFPGLAWAVAGSMTAAGANLVLLRTTRRSLLCGHLGLCILATILALPLVVVGGIGGANFAWLYLLPLGAAVVIDVRGAAIWTGVSLGLTLLFWSLPFVDLPLVNLIPLELRHANILVTRLLHILAIGAIGVSFVIGQRGTEHQLARANSDLLRESGYVQLLVHAAVSANQATDFDEALRESMERICVEMAWEAGHVCAMRDDGQLVSSGVVYSVDPSQYAELERLTLATEYAESQLAGRAAATGEPQCREGHPEIGLSARADAARAMGLRSAIAVPVIVSGEVRAVLEFASTKPLPDMERLFEVFSHICVQLARVAERSAIQARLQQSQKMEAVGQLAAGLAHEINNPMSYVRSNLQVLRREWETLAGELRNAEDAAGASQRLADVGELVDESIEGVERTISIVRDVKAFSHRGNGNGEHESWMPADLSELLEDAFRVSSPQAHAGIRFSHAISECAPCVCNANQLRQVFVNLIVNAIQAIGEQGEIRLATEQAGTTLIARVEDNGPGMTEDTRARLFDPFFTTKPVGEGTGLGLSVSYEIIRAHGGEIRVTSQLGAGTQFEVRLPIARTVEPDPDTQLTPQRA